MLRVSIHYLTLIATLTHFIAGCGVHHALGSCDVSKDSVCRTHASCRGHSHCTLSTDQVADSGCESQGAHGEPCGICRHGDTATAPPCPTQRTIEADSRRIDTHYRSIKCPRHDGSDHSHCADDSCKFMASRSSDMLILAMTGDFCRTHIPLSGGNSCNDGHRYFLPADPAAPRSSCPLYALCSVFLL